MRGLMAQACADLYACDLSRCTYLPGRLTGEHESNAAHALQYKVQLGIQTEPCHSESECESQDYGAAGLTAISDCLHKLQRYNMVHEATP